MRRVLLVDDDPVMLRGYSLLLKSAGYEVTEAATGLEALSKAEEEKPDLILLDVVLPDISGLDVCGRLKSLEALEDTFVVLLSGVRTGSDDQAEGLETGADAYITRPIANRELLARVHAMLRIRDAQMRLRMRERQQAAVAELGRYALEEDDPKRFWERCAKLLAETLRVSRCAIFEPVEEGPSLVLRAGVGWKEEELGQILFEVGNETPEGQAFQSLQPVSVDDWAGEKRFPQDSIAASGPVGSALAVPILGRSRCFGVVSVHQESANAFGPNDRHFLESVANVMAAACEHRHAEAEAIKVRKWEAISLLAGGIAHDFNNLLAVIIGNVNLMQLSTKLTSALQKSLQDIESAALRAAELTHRFLSLATDRVPVKKVFALRDLLSQAAAALEGSKVTVDWVFPEDPGWDGMLEGDEKQIIEVFTNLFMNSREAMPDGGRITVCVEETSSEPARPHGDLPPVSGSYFKITVKDQGRGIPESLLDRVFDPYFSTKARGVEKGTGLGLTIAESVVRKHGGVMRVKSQENKGTQVNVYLPVCRKGREIPLPRVPREVPLEAKILVMDDEEIFRKMVGQLLESLGCRQVKLVANGEEAVDGFIQAKEAEEPFDLVILDLTARDGLGGEEVLKRLLAVDPSVKAIISSGYVGDPVLADYRARGFRAALPKPYSIHDLRNAILLALSESSASPAEHFHGSR